MPETNQPILNQTTQSHQKKQFQLTNPLISIIQKLKLTQTTRKHTNIQHHNHTQTKRKLNRNIKAKSKILIPKPNPEQSNHTKHQPQHKAAIATKQQTTSKRQVTNHNTHSNKAKIKTQYQKNYQRINTINKINITNQLATHHNQTIVNTKLKQTRNV